jgi:molecular chaperone DnaK
VEVSRSITHGSDDVIRIILVEGPSQNHFITNKKVGELRISGHQVKRDLPRGMEIDLNFELSESRDLKVYAYVNPSGPEFSQIFVPALRHVSVDTLTEEVQMLHARLQDEKNEAIKMENYELAQELEQLRGPVRELNDEAKRLTPDDRTDDRYKLDDRKRKLAQDVLQLTAGKRMDRLRCDYQATKDEVTAIVTESGTDHERRQLQEVISREDTFLNSQIPQKLEAEIGQLRHIEFQILWRTPKFLIEWFQYLLGKREVFNDQLQAKNLIEAGKKFIAAEDYDKLADVNGRLHSLLPQGDKDSKEARPFTGIH